jgi:putative aldouronate transport system substrate-binding protein
LASSGLALAFSAAALAQEQAAGTPPAAVTESQPQGTFPLTAERKTLRVLVLGNPVVEDFATNAFTQWYQERTNVEIEWEVVSPDGANAGLNVRLSSGDLPDAILNFTIDPAVLQLHGGQGTFVALEALIDDHGVYIDQVFEQYAVARDVITAADGHIYSMPAINDCYQCSMPQKLWIHQPWLDALGLDLPTTTEEYAAVLQAFRDNDPNGNGQADEVPLSSSTSVPLDTFFMNSFTFDPGGKRLYLDGGTVIAAYTTEGWKQGILYLKDIFAKGLLSEEAFSQTQDQIKQLGMSSTAVRLGSAPGLFPGSFMTIENSLEAGRWTDYTSVSPLAGPDGTRQTARNPYTPFAVSSFVVTSACDDPALAVRWADGMYEIEATMRMCYGIPGENWRWATEGETGIDGEPAWWKRLTTYGGVQNAHWNEQGPALRTEKLRHSEAVEGINLAQILYQQTREKYEQYQQPAELWLPPLFFNPDQAETVATLGSTIEDLVNQTFAQAIIGEIDIEAQWDAYIEQLNGSGLQEFLKAHQEAYDARSIAARASIERE